jgi:hypothetical protein
MLKKSLLPASMHTWTCLIMDCCTLLKVPGLLWIDRHVNVSLHFPLELNTLRIFITPQIKIQQFEANMLLVCTTKEHIFIWPLFLVLVWGTHSWNLSKYFRHTLYRICVQEVIRSNKRNKISEEENESCSQI